MAGILRTPRMPMVPMVNMSAVVKGAPSTNVNDEVAAILKGLKLDKNFFANRIRPEPLEELKPADPTEAIEKSKEGSEVSGRARQRMSIRQSRKKLTVQKFMPKPKNSDFDIYLNEAVMPVLAQALDALCRQLARMNEQGDQLDPKVRARFNPLTWLGQQLLRRHPKCARTPRRALLYRNFKDWADWERGRREVLRRRYRVLQVFSGFMLKGLVAHDTVPLVVAAIDDTFCVQGALKNSVEIESAMRGDFSYAGDPLLSTRKVGQVNPDGMCFEEFWYRFGTAVMRHDIVPYSLLIQGEAQRQKEEEEAEEWQMKKEMAEEERQNEEAEKRRLTSEYTKLHEKIMVDEHILSILNDNKILTGDDVREGDVGYEFEAKPEGPHIDLLADLFRLLGLYGKALRGYVTEEDENDITSFGDDDGSNQGLQQSKGLQLRASTKKHKNEDAPEESRFTYWGDNLAKAWGVLQKVHHAEMIDGVVDGELLQKVLVPPVGFNMLKAKVEYELERQMETDDPELQEDEEERKQMRILLSHKKPTKEQLCQRLGMTMSRLDWLHKLFESYLPPSDDPDAPAPCCMYPECPASLKKEQFRAVIMEVEPNLSRAQFDARFTRIDQDGSGLIEFDEFAIWVHSADVRVTGNAARKMTFEELARRYQEPLELIEYLHTMFEDALPDGEDNYPEEPVGLAKTEALQLAKLIMPQLDPKLFAESFDFVDQFSRQRGHCDFDEFIELLDLDDLPAELRDRFEEN